MRAERNILASFIYTVLLKATFHVYVFIDAHTICFGFFSAVAANA